MSFKCLSIRIQTHFLWTRLHKTRFLITHLNSNLAASIVRAKLEHKFLVNILFFVKKVAGLSSGPKIRWTSQRPAQVNLFLKDNYFKCVPKVLLIFFSVIPQSQPKYSLLLNRWRIIPNFIFIKRKLG